VKFNWQALQIFLDVFQATPILALNEPGIHFARLGQAFEGIEYMDGFSVRVLADQARRTPSRGSDFSDIAIDVLGRQ
jgi:hypothetical protein